MSHSQVIEDAGNSEIYVSQIISYNADDEIDALSIWYDSGLVQHIDYDDTGELPYVTATYTFADDSPDSEIDTIYVVYDDMVAQFIDFDLENAFDFDAKSYSYTPSGILESVYVEYDDGFAQFIAFWEDGSVAESYTFDPDGVLIV